ncbi:MAG TPA: glycoside hydrolase family 3 N-terminal domain-containing protein [Gemmatimonadales bacterium]|jgi:beta-glucosidase|nr:glycoside hydrolase family 3 N-terminal domain-containing protein [Gemmatimonadales bacterium]
MTRARLVFPALRARNGVFTHERAKITAALAAGVGGFILFGGTRAAVTALTRALRRNAKQGLLIGSDLERGPGQQFRGLTELPPPAALGFLDDLDATYAAGMITATEAHAVGVSWAFAPVCDLDLEARNPIVQTRSFGPDASRVGAHAAKWIAGCQEHGVMACAKHYPGHGRATTDSHEGVPVIETSVIELRLTDAVPFGAAVQAGVGSVMSAFVAYPGWDESGVAAAFSKPILGYLRDPLGFKGLVVTDAFIMGGATAAQSEGPASVAAVSAGCDALLYPTDWQGVIRALDAVPDARAEEALERYEAALKAWGRGGVGTLDEATLGEHRRFADDLANRAVHLLREEAPRLGAPLAVEIVDDDVGGPYAIAPRDVFGRALRSAEHGARSRIVVVYAEPRSWKGRGDLGARSVAQLERLVPGAALVVLFGHPRLVAQIPGDVPVVCAWHGQALMQRAAARWVIGRAATIR